MPATRAGARSYLGSEDGTAKAFRPDRPRSLVENRYSGRQGL